MDTRERILDTAQRLAQERGFNAFSYADISEAIGIRKASIHHHFAAKEDLELALVARYRADFDAKLDGILQKHGGDALECLRQYGKLYQATLAKGGICLCGMMASDMGALPQPLRLPLQHFFDEHKAWLAGVLDMGRKHKQVGFDGSAARKAQAMLATLQGGLLIANALQDKSFLKTLLDDALAALSPH
jgi:TetR/AcrR family transcriptional repressor of nem operon